MIGKLHLGVGKLHHIILVFYIFVSEIQQFVKELTEVTMNSLVPLLLEHTSVIRNQQGLTSVI